LDRCKYFGTNTGSKIDRHPIDKTSEATRKNAGGIFHTAAIVVPPRTIVSQIKIMETARYFASEKSKGKFRP